MKSYKDLDKDIILNAPEGAMWWCHLNGYYKYQGSDVYVYYPEECDWFYSANQIIDEEYLPTEQEEGIVRYKLPLYTSAHKIEDAPIEVDELEMHRVAYQAIKNAGFDSPEELLAEHLALLDTQGGHVDYEVLTPEDSLIKRLEFLQNLANKFPEIKAEAIKFMECELDGYMNTLWEKDNDNG